MSFLKEALEYNRMGLSVIPIKPRDKKPLIQWEPYQKERASAGTIKHWFESWPLANIGLVTGAISGCVVLDIDTEEAKEKLKSNTPDYDFANIPRSRTGKGWQLFFKHPGIDFPNRTAVFPGLDVRGDGGYVVAPPSIHPNGKPYKWEVNLNSELPKIPLELFKLIQSSTTIDSHRDRFDTVRALAGVPEGQRDETVFKLACKLRNADVPIELAETLVCEAAKNCQPAFSEQIALEKVSRAYNRYRPKEETKSIKQGALWPEFITAKTILQMPPDPTRWLWDRCLPATACSLLVAKAKVGKSTFAVCLSISVARGLTFLGRATQQAPVAYLSLDAPMTEIADVLLNFGLKDDDAFFLHVGSAPANATDWLIQRIKENHIRFAVIDTIQRFFRFQNINDYAEVVRITEPLLEAARIAGCHLMFTHHARKDSMDDLDSAVGTVALRGQFYQYLHLKKLPDSEIRIFRTDGRGGINFQEYAIGFDKLGFLALEGTREDAEVLQTKPRILEWLANQDSDITERELRSNIKGQPGILGRALRQLLKDGEVERVGKGKRGDPYRYSVAPTLSLVKNDHPQKGGITLIYKDLRENIGEINQQKNEDDFLMNSDTYSGLSEKKTSNKPETHENENSLDNSDTYSGLLRKKNQINQKKPDKPAIETSAIDKVLEEIESAKKAGKK